MNVSQVEAAAPPPPVPTAGPSATLRTVSPAQVAIQQAAFNAKREEIEKDEAHAHSTKSTKTMKSKKSSVNIKPKKSDKKTSAGGKKNKSKNSIFGKSLLGSPADIFKSKTSKKR